MHVKEWLPSPVAILTLFVGGFLKLAVLISSFPVLIMKGGRCILLIFRESTAVPCLPTMGSPGSVSMVSDIVPFEIYWGYSYAIIVVTVRYKKNS